MLEHFKGVRFSPSLNKPEINLTASVLKWMKEGIWDSSGGAVGYAEIWDSLMCLLFSVIR